RAVWPTVGPVAVVGASPLARALARLLELALVPAEPGGELRAAADALAGHDVVVALLTAPAIDLAPLDGAPLVVLASEPDGDGTVELAVRGAPLPTRERDPLGELVASPS